MTTEGHDPSQEQRDRQVIDRLALPLLIPATVFLFAVLAIYGLSRIYLELNDYKVGDVTMATPLAIVVSLFILLSAIFLANQKRIMMAQIAGIFMVAASLITAGAIWAAVHEEEQVAGHEETVTPVGSQTPAAPGTADVTLIDPFAVEVAPASVPVGDVTFNVTNGGTIIHNLRVIQADLAPDELPLDSAGLQVDETQVNVVGQLPEFGSGETATLTLTLESGSYVLICNVATHYEQGMYTAFTVD